MPAREPHDGTPGAPVIVITGLCAPATLLTTAAAVVVGCQEAGLAVVATLPVVVGSPAQASVAGVPLISHLTGASTIIRAHVSLPQGSDPASAMVPVPVVAAQTRTRMPAAAVQGALLASLTRPAPSGLGSASTSAQNPTGSGEADLVVCVDLLGLLAPMDEDGSSVLDSLDAARDLGARVGVIVVSGPSVHELTVAATTAQLLQARSLDALGLVLAMDAGSSGAAATKAAVANAIPEAVCAAAAQWASPMTGLSVLGTVPPSAAGWDPQTFQDRAGAWLPLT